MHRPARSICCICDSISTQHRPAARVLFTKNHRPPTVQNITSLSTYCNRQRESSPVIPLRFPQTRTHSTETHHDATRPTTSSAPSLHPSSIQDIENYLKTSQLKVFSQHGIPSEENVSAALEACHMLAKWYMDDAIKPQIAHAIQELDTTSSTLLSLDGTKKTSPQTTKSPADSLEYSAKLRQILDKISETAYLILAHPPVVLTPNLLKQYVQIQAKLGRPETLPRVFQLYASKPAPRQGSSPLSYTKPNPNRIANAIDQAVADKALDVAIKAKNLDAAIGIIENGVAAKAFVRNKVIRNGAFPFGVFAATPIAAYGLAQNLSGMQQTMDSVLATNMTFVGILAYIGFTASIGIIAVTTANDQMKRVSWAPGQPLRSRWMREEERAALDKVVCAWGFQEAWRQGEEEGPVWEALREFVFRKGMIVDRVELMEGMT
ncbi:hypothetical protein F5Y16DRAFT_319591 [Xylariaceae sp. FL0255]|nr:hypothetical protein F5Y16DRAFT_319591 [Xylariaceae sp. FL0255]